jgi:hypothetical protein
MADLYLSRVPHPIQRLARRKNVGMNCSQRIICQRVIFQKITLPLTGRVAHQRMYEPYPGHKIGL